MEELCSVPEGCIAHVISLTSPRDACRLSAAFCSAADSDAVWKRFLPSDYPSILSRAAVDPHPTMLGCSSAKDLFFHLCHHPLLLDTATLIELLVGQIEWSKVLYAVGESSVNCMGWYSRILGMESHS